MLSFYFMLILRKELSVFFSKEVFPTESVERSLMWKGLLAVVTESFSFLTFPFFFHLLSPNTQITSNSISFSKQRLFEHEIKAPSHLRCIRNTEEYPELEK